eukprot:2789204-Pleurochrysis_carterae.AAC.2
MSQAVGYPFHYMVPTRNAITRAIVRKFAGEVRGDTWRYAEIEMLRQTARSFVGFGTTFSHNPL